MDNWTTDLGCTVLDMIIETGGVLSPSPLGITHVNADNSLVHVGKKLFESISRTVTCTGELSALTCVIPRGEGLNTSPVEIIISSTVHPKSVVQLSTLSFCTLPLYGTE